MIAWFEISKRSNSELLAAWVILISWAIACAAYPYPAMSEPVSIWTVFTPEISDLPHTDILALAPDVDGALWIGTHGGGLARIDKDGRWQNYTTASTKGGLPNDLVLALAPDMDGALWIGTERGLARRDKDGYWENYTSASTKGELPNDSVRVSNWPKATSISS